MNLGPLNRRARLWRDNPIKQAGGAVKSQLVHVKWLPVTVGAIDANDTQAAERDSTLIKGEWTTRFLDLPTGAYLLDFEGRRYRVVRLRELGRREGTVIHAERTV